MSDAMLFMCTRFPDQRALSKTEGKVTMPQMAERIREQCAPTKAELPLLKLGFFGDKRTDKGCLRSNANLRWVSGVEFDYDREEISFDDACETLYAAGVMCIVYTTASHTEEKPRFRVLAPLTLGQQPEHRNKYLARLNGLFGGTVSTESWTLSQAFYFGSVGDTPTHKVEEIHGFCIDQLDDLDTGAIGKVQGVAGNVSMVAGEIAEADSELIRRIITGDSLHPALCSIAARLIGRGLHTAAVAEQLRGYMLVTPEANRDERWHHRFGQIPSLVESAVPKFAADNEKRDAWKAVARMTHRMIKERRLVEDIIWQATEVARQMGIDERRALTLADKICAEAAENWNV